MKKRMVYIILAFSLLIFISLFIINSNKDAALSLNGDSGNEVVSNEIYDQIKSELKHLEGLELITDEEFRRDLLIFMNADEKNLFYCLSKRNLQENYSGVTNVEEYEKKLKERDIKADRTPYVFLEILGFKKLTNKKYQVDVLVKTSSEGIHYKMKNRYIFVKEDRGWMYDTYDPNFIETVEILE
ncbi:MAG: hypothetical protein GXY86_12900 [Firmicutes bacterium]|nr:hypothetical protein [Bacillota bacterium]